MPGLSKPKPRKPEANPDDTAVVAGSGNVFVDIGLPDPDLYRLKAEFVRAVRKAMGRRKLDVSAAASILRIPPEKLESLLRGQTKPFTIDRLVRMVTALGGTVSLVAGTPGSTPSRNKHRALPAA